MPFNKDNGEAENHRVGIKQKQIVMKKLFITLVALLGFIANMNAELTQSELSKLTSQERQTYLSQLKELNAKLKDWVRRLGRTHKMPYLRRFGSY